MGVVLRGWGGAMIFRLWGVRYMWVESARRREDGRAVAPRRMMGALTKVFSVIIVEPLWDWAVLDC